jgi:hypothetical protein
MKSAESSRCVRSGHSTEPVRLVPPATQLSSSTVRVAKDESAVVISPQVIDRADLCARLAAATRAAESATNEVLPSSHQSAPLDASADRLHHLYAVRYSGPPERAPGILGRASFELKRVAGRLQSWEADAEAARFATDVASSIRELHQQVEALQKWNARLQRDVRRLRIEADGAGPRT